MNSGGPFDPKSTPPAPADPAHTVDVDLLLSQQEEEEFARRYSMPTRLLGWMLIAGFVFQLLVGSLRDEVDMGGFVFLIAGFYVKRGSQAALRFVVFLASSSALALLSSIWELAHMRPLQIGQDWYHVRDLKLWTLGISPYMYLLAESILGIVALRTRRLPFWTKAVRVWACVFGTAILISTGIATLDWYRIRKVEQALPEEISAARSYVSSTTPSAFNPTSIKSAQAIFSRYPQIESVRWKSFSSGTSQIYQRDSTITWENGRSQDYELWQHDISGDWGKLEMKLILPDKFP